MGTARSAVVNSTSACVKSAVVATPPSPNEHHRKISSPLQRRGRREWQKRGSSAGSVNSAGKCERRMAGTLKAVDSANLRGEIAGALVYTFCRSEDLWQSRWGRKPRVRLPVDRALRPPGFSVPPPDCSPGRVPMKRRSGGWSAESPFPASVTRCRRCRSSVCLVVFWRGPKAATTRGTPAAPLRQRRSALAGKVGTGQTGGDTVVGRGHRALHSRHR